LVAGVAGSNPAETWLLVFVFVTCSE